MAFELTTVDDLVRLAHAGGGFKLVATLRDINDLVRIAHAAGSSGAKITFTGLMLTNINDLIRIASAGKGNVNFAD